MANEIYWWLYYSFDSIFFASFFICWCSVTEPQYFNHNSLRRLTSSKRENNSKTNLFVFDAWVCVLFVLCVFFLYSRWWSKHTVAQAICQTVCQLSFRATFFLLLSVYFCSGFAIASFFLLQFHCKAHVNPPFVRSFLFFSFRLPPDSRCILSFWVYKMQCILLSLASFSIFFSSCLGFPATILTINKQQLMMMMMMMMRTVMLAD